MGKPLEIIQLEKELDIIFEEDSYLKSRGFINRIAYSLNSDGKVNALSIDRSSITDVSPIKNFKDVEYLSLLYNKIEDISPLFPLPKLEIAYLGGNQIKDITPINGSSRLEKLILYSNPIEDINLLNDLINLQELYCQDLKITNVNFIEKFVNLVEVDFHDNYIKKIPKPIAERFSWLKGALNIGLSDNKIGLGSNPLEFPPNSVIAAGNEIVQNYYKTSEEYGHAPLSEGRVIVIGDGSAGKSSLIERILHNNFELGKGQTNGIFIENWKLEHEDGRELIFHIWDFGGQEIQHAVHKFFFTEGCLYVLVLDNRKEEEPEYWLQQIESLGGSAHVLVVFNKQDDNRTPIVDRKFLREKYPNIMGFYDVSCKTGFNIEKFKKDLEEEVVNLRTVNEQFPNNWFTIKKTIEEYTSGEQHYLDYEKYVKICEKNNAASEKTQKLLLKYFTTIGAVTWFGDTYLNFLHVLSPKWITQGVYKIITAKKLPNY